MDISQNHKIISLYLKAVVIISAVVGVILSAVAAKGIFMGGGRVFMYFTIQSNIAVALVELIGFTGRWQKRSTTYRAQKASITTTGDANSTKTRNKKTQKRQKRSISLRFFIMFYFP